MALLDLARTSGTRPSFTDRVYNRLSAAISTFADWNDTRRTRKVLSQLSSHELDDIGLTRGDIDAILRQSRY